MTINIPLGQDDRNFLTSEKESKEEINSQLNDSNTTLEIDIGKLLLLDIPFKKQLDAPHQDIFMYEEEIRRLIGTTVFKSLEEEGFLITDSQPDSRIFINDGRVKITENNVEVVNVPIIPKRGFSRSQPAGTDFDIWTRDRKGNTTSSKNGSNSFTIDTTNKILNVEIDGVANEIDLANVPGMTFPMTVAGESISGWLQALLQAVNSGGFTNSSCVFNPELNTFHIVSGTAGGNSSVQVLPASSDDLRSTLGFDQQYIISGKYANNLLNVEIDGEAFEIEISDFRLCFEDSDLGYNNDENGVFWSGSLNTLLGYRNNVDPIGPFLCSGIDNGKKVASSIEAQLRLKGDGGFKDCICNWFSDDETFVIYSGTFGSSSSVKVLAASDSLRDARTLLGFDSPAEEVGNENSYETLGTLSTFLNSQTNITATTPSDNNRTCHSILYTPPNGILLSDSFQNYSATITPDYDEASRSGGRLYPNGKFVVDNSNNKINFLESNNIELTATVASDTYETPLTLADAITTALNSVGSSVYECTHDIQTKLFTITSDLSGGIFTLLWQSGTNVANSIGNALGFALADLSRSDTYTSDYSVDFSAEDFFDPELIKQFFGIPQFIDDTVDEQSALQREEEYLENEESTSSLLSDIENLIAYDNEVLIDGWESFVAFETAVVEQQYSAIKAHRGAYANHIAETGTIINQKTTALNNLGSNRNNLLSLVSHASLLNLTQEIDIFNAGVDFTNGGTQTLGISISAGSNDKRIYNNPTPSVQYAFGSKHIPGKWSPTGLYTTNITYTPEQLNAMRLSYTNVGTSGYSYTPQDADGLYLINVSADTAATILSTNLETYNLEGNDDLILKIDGAPAETAVFDATAGYTESNAAVESGFVIQSGVNDKINFEETIGSELTVTLAAGTYTGVTLANEIQTKLNLIGSSTYSVDYNSTNTDKFTIISDGTGGSGIFNLLWATGSDSANSVVFTMGFNNLDDTGSLIYVSDNSVEFTILTGINDSFAITIDSIISTSDIIISQGNYSAASLIIEMSTKIAADASFNSSNFTITYPSNKIRITSTTKGTSSNVSVDEGTNDFLRTIDLDGDTPTVGGGDVSDKTAVTASEVMNVLNAEISGISASVESGKIRITTLSTKGSISSIEVVGGNAASIIGFTIGTVFGSNQNNKLKVDIDGDTSQDSIELTTSASIQTGSVMASNIQTQLQIIGSGGYSAATCTFNETTPFQTFTDALRIISGTTGLTSTVDVNNKTLKIITGTNDKIDFEETASIELTATLSSGFYNGSTLATEIQTQLNAVGSSNYSVSYSNTTKKITITSDLSGGGGLFNLLWNSGSNSAINVSNLLSFYNSVDKTGTNSYISDGFVKLQSAIEELGFDNQTTEPGHGLTGAKVTITDTQLTTTLEWTDNGGGTRTDLDIDLTSFPNDNIAGLISTINSETFYDCEVDSAYLLGKVSEPFKLANGDQLIVSVDGGSDQTVTFNAIAGTSISGSGVYTRVTSGMNDTLQVFVDGVGGEISIGTQDTPQKIAAAIQQQVRALPHSTPSARGGLLQFTCIYSGGQYILTSGTSGTGSSVQVLDGTSANAAAVLKLGIVNGGTETAGSGDFVNNFFVTIAEVISKLSSLSDVTISGTDYIKITSNLTGASTRIQIKSSSAASKLGFDISDNADDYPSNDLSSVNSNSIINITDEDIFSPAVYNVLRGWREDEGNIEITYYTIDDSQISVRKSIVSTRLSNISTRYSQITSEANAAASGLTVALFNERKNAVTLRLNKNNGSYIAIGDKQNQIDNNNDTISKNTNLINEIDSLL